MSDFSIDRFRVRDQFICDGTATFNGAVISTAGLTFGDNTADLLGFWGVTATSQPTSANEAAVASTAFVTATGTISSATPYGLLTTAAVQALIDLANSSAARATALTTLVNQLRADLVSVGIIKGS